MFNPVIYPDDIEPLVQFIEDTAPENIVAETYEKLRNGTSVKQMLLASGLAVMRSSDLPPGHHGGPLHPISGIHAVHSMSERMTGDYALMPVVQNVALSNKHINSMSMGPYIMADAQPESVNNSVEETLEAMPYHLSRGAYNAMDSYYLFLLEKLTPGQVLDHLMQVAIPKNQKDDHNFLFPSFTWRALDYFGWEYAKYLIRPAVRYVTRPPGPSPIHDIDDLIEEHDLLKRVLRVKTGDDETEAVGVLAEKIGLSAKFGDIPGIMAQALADGLSLEGVVEGLSVGGSRMFLRSQTGNPMDVHIHTGANIRRYLIGQRDLSMNTKLRALLTWHAGPEVRSAQFKLAPVHQPEADRVAAQPTRTQEESLRDMEAFIGTLPIGERLPSLGLGLWMCTDEVKEAAAMAQQYADCNFDPDALIQMLDRIVCRDSFSEMHAYKHNQATYEEFHNTRAEYRWTHLVSAVQGAAISHGRMQEVYEYADKVAHF
jgi:hypothetical protein